MNESQEQMNPIRRIAIVGVGLIGGSFALAVRNARWQGEILGVSSPPTIERALALGIIDRGATLEEAAQSADLLYLAQPVLAIVSCIESLGSLYRPGSLITDAGSTKQLILQAAGRYLPPGAFIGGHPMAGKESRGISVAESTLFKGKTYVLVRSGNSTPPLLTPFLDLIAAIGARVVWMTPEEHDRVVAYTSHLPQLASTALAALLNTEVRGVEREIAGSGLVDQTRLALSSFEIWKDILETNHDQIQQALSRYIDKLIQIRDNLTACQLKYEFDSGADFAREIRRSAPLFAENVDG